MKLTTPLAEVEYRCMSHVWGDVKGCVWTNHEIDGIDYEVEFREEKRDKLLHIMKEHGGYWWIDLLCINQGSKNKPLYLMEDIYKYCKECIAMIDCAVNVLKESVSICSGSLKERMSYATVMKIGDMANWQISQEDREPVLYEPYVPYRPTLDTMTSLFESTWFKRIWTLQESVLPSKILLTHETTSFVDYVDLSDMLDLVRELKEYLCREGYASGEDFVEDNPGLSGMDEMLRNEWYKSPDESFTQDELYRMHQGMGRFDEPDDSSEESDDSSKESDILSNSTDTEPGYVRSRNGKVYYVGYVFRENGIPDHRDKDSYLCDMSFKKLYYSIENMIKLRNRETVRDAVEVIIGLDRRCKCPHDYFYGVAGLVGVKLDSGLDVREAFYMFVTKLVEMDERIAWQEPDWTKEHELYKCITVRDLIVVEEGSTVKNVIHIKQVHGNRSANTLHDVYSKLHVYKSEVCYMTDESDEYDLFSSHRKTYMRRNMDTSRDERYIRSRRRYGSVTVDVDGIEITMDVAILETFLLRLMSHSMDKECEMMSDFMPMLKDGLYIYIIEHMLVLSEMCIGDFKLHNIGLTKSVYRLVKDSKLVGNVFMNCGCRERSNKEEEIDRAQEYQRGFSEFQDMVDRSVTTRDYDNFLKYGLNWEAYY